MRFLSWLISLPVVGAVVVFVLQNRMRVELSFWPFDFRLEMPVSILSLGLLALGFILGVCVAGVTTFSVSREARKYKREAAALNKKLLDQPTATVAVPARFVGGAYKTVPPVLPQAAPKRGFLQKIFSKKGS